MGKGRTIILGGVAAIAVVAAVVGVRTATFAPNDIADGREIKLAPAPAYDLDAAVAHLSAAAQIRTISHQDPAENEVTSELLLLAAVICPWAFTVMLAAV